MMKAWAILGAMLLTAAPAAATTLTFDGATTSPLLAVYSEQGYVFTGAPGAFFKSHDNSCSPALEGPNPFAPPYEARFYLKRADSGLFDFVSLDVFQADQNGLGVPITFSALTATGEQINYTAFTPEYGRAATPATRTSIILPSMFQRLKSVSWANGAEWHQFDNVVVRSAASSIPELASWVLIFSGFGVVGCGLRRRKPTDSGYGLLRV